MRFGGLYVGWPFASLGTLSRRLYVAHSLGRVLRDARRAAHMEHQVRWLGCRIWLGRDRPDGSLLTVAWCFSPDSALCGSHRGCFPGRHCFRFPDQTNASQNLLSIIPTL